MKIFTSLFLLLCVFRVTGNNLQISSSSIYSVDSANGYALIQFSASWDNSWRDTANWDAIWLFGKFREKGDTGEWSHITLNYVDGSSDGHTAPSGSTINTSSDGKGVFLYRNANGSGTSSFSNVLLRWNFEADSLATTDSIDLKIFGVEMVYVPQGAFYLGDGQTTAAQVYGNFESITSGAPYQVTSEAAITLGGGGAGSLGNNDGYQMWVGSGSCGCLTGSGDDFDDATSQTLPADFPKGYDAFYCMKYETTQQQMVDMLNCVSSTQQAYLADTGSYYKFFGGSFVDGRYSISETGGEYSASEPHIPLIYCDWIRAAAYADWSALRPMTELEFEKACRGFDTTVVNEFAWGNASADVSDNLVLSNQSAANEGISSGYDSSGTSGNVWVRSGSQSMTVIARVGIFAAHSANSGRVSSGASYWGIFDLSGNAWERTVSVGHSQGRSYTGIHGDGDLDSTGRANITTWPGTFGGQTVNSNIGVGYRGGGFIYPTSNTDRNGRVSNRRLSSSYYNTVIQDDGARFVRTAE